MSRDVIARKSRVILNKRDNVAETLVRIPFKRKL